jgi:tryptophan halogenase
MGLDELKRFLGDIQVKVQRTVASLPGHQRYVQQLCAPYRREDAMAKAAPGRIPGAEAMSP